MNCHNFSGKLSLFFILALTPGLRAEGTLTTIRAYNGKCIDVMHESKDTFMPIHLWDCTGNANQSVEIIEHANHRYSFKFLHSHKCMDLLERHKHSGAGLHQYPCNGTDNQKIIVDQVLGTDLVRFKLSHSGKCIDYKSKPGAILTQEDCDPDMESQRFSIHRISGDTYDSKGFDVLGFDANGFDRKGFNRDGVHKETSTFYSPQGFDLRGFDRNKLPDFRFDRVPEFGFDFYRRQLKHLEFLQNFNPSLNYRPNIYILVLDTLRTDYIGAELSPELQKFKEDSIHTDISLSGATSTHPSMYSLFTSQPSYEYTAAALAGMELGSLPLSILKHKLHYKINVLGVDFICLEERVEAQVNAFGSPDILSNAQMKWGLNSYLLDECVERGTLQSESHAGNYHVRDAKRFKQLTEMSKNSSNEGNLFILHAHGVHSPQAWTDEDEIPKVEGEQVTEWKYRNGLRSMDRIFGNFIENLKRDNKFDDALIVVFGDHGEVFPKHLDYSDHGDYEISKELSHVPLYFKFPSGYPHQDKYTDLTKVSGIIDVFPTIFDILGIYNNVAPFLSGKPIYDKRVHVVPVSRVGTCNELAFYAYPYKLYVKFRTVGGREYKSEEDMKWLSGISPEDFEFVKLQDFNDNLIDFPTERIDLDRYTNYGGLFGILMNRFNPNLSKAKLRPSFSNGKLEL